MNAKEYLKIQVGAYNRTACGILENLTDEQLNWTPTGTANTIGGLLLHAFAGEDMFVQGFMAGKPRLFESEGWAEKIGVNPPKMGESWDFIKDKQLSVAPIMEYIDRIQSATGEYLAGLTDEDLDRKVKAWGGREARVADVFSMLVVHGTMHMGEVSTLKGIQGGKGLPH